MKRRILTIAAAATAIALLTPAAMLAQDFRGWQPLHAGTMMTLPPMVPGYEPLVGTATPESIRQDGELWAAPPSRDLPWQSTWPGYASSFTVGRITAVEPYPRPTDEQQAQVQVQPTQSQQTQQQADAAAPTAPQPPAPTLGPAIQADYPRPQSRVMQFNPHTGKLEDARNIRRW